MRLEIQKPFAIFGDSNTTLMRYRPTRGSKLLAAEFRDHNDPNITLVLHPSTHKSGIWQLSRFEETEATGHTEYRDLNDALNEIPPAKYDLIDMSYRKESGYVHCGCRDCFEIAIGIPGDFCHECEESGCESGEECRRPDGEEK